MLAGMKTIRQLTVESLAHMAAQGSPRAVVDESARAILREWMLHPRKAAEPAPPAPPAAEAAALPPVQPVQPKPAAAEMGVEEKLAYLRERALHWKPALALGTLREKMVFATGDPHARLMLVGEAPGYDEERLGEPFVGRAGQKLNQVLAAMGLGRGAVYISNICKWRPAMGPQQGMANRPPTAEEIAACVQLVLAEIRAIRPQCIVCLGGTAAKGLLGVENASVGSLRGKWHDCQGVPVRVTYHPSYLLRNESLSARRAVWEDMLAAMEALGMPVSEKQRRYFLPS